MTYELFKLFIFFSFYSSILRQNMYESSSCVPWMPVGIEETLMALMRWTRKTIIFKLRLGEAAFRIQNGDGGHFGDGGAGLGHFLPRSSWAASSRQFLADYRADFPQRMGLLLGLAETRRSNGNAVLRRLHAACQVVPVLEGIAARKIRRGQWVMLLLRGRGKMFIESG